MEKLHVYQVEGEFSFKVRARDPSIIRRKVGKMIRESGFDEKNFEILVKREGVEEIVPAEEEQP